MATWIEVITDRLKSLEFQGFWGGILLWLTLSFAVGAIAQGKGRSRAYTLLALFLSPFVGMLVVLCLTDRRAAEIADLRARLAPPAARSSLELEAPPKAAPQSASSVWVSAAILGGLGLVIVIYGVLSFRA